MKKTVFLLTIIASVLLTGCGASKLLPPTVQVFAPVDGYEYFYITPTAEVTSETTYVSGNYYYGVQGSTRTTSVNPTDEISGFFIKKGYIRVPQITSEVKDKAVIINYSVSGERDMLGGKAKEITLQVVDAKTMKVVCVASAEGIGATDSDDIKIAIHRCLEEMFKEDTKQ